jgi:hypothetical protein
MKQLHLELRVFPKPGSSLWSAEYLLLSDCLRPSAPEARAAKTRGLASRRCGNDESDLFHLVARRQGAIAKSGTLADLEAHGTKLYIAAEDVLLAFPEAALYMCIHARQTQRLAFQRCSVLDVDGHMHFLVRTYPGY